jgi:hypothetical protein
MNNIFEIASRNRIRFESSKGLLTAEDLWSLPLTASGDKASLDSIAVKLYSQTKEGERISFVEDVVASDNNALVAFEIVKHIIAVRKAENAAARLESDRRAKKQMILQAMAERQSSDLKAMSMEDLQKAFAEL